MTSRLELPGRAASPWLELDRPERPTLEAQREADVAVVGAGIVGLTTALLLARGGADVVVLEGGRIGQGVTGRTTAKLSSLHGLTYASMERSHGGETTRVYAEANEAGIVTVAQLVEELSIDCDLRRRDNFTYVEDEDSRDEIEGEVAAASRAGLQAELVETSELPFPIAAAVRVPGQAEFHPVRYLLGLADELDSDGPRVFEQARAVGVDGESVTVEGGRRVRAERVVLATHLPILDRGGQFALAEPERSYALGVRLAGPAPEGMYLSASGPTRSLRSHPWDGGELFIVGGESARMGSDEPVDAFQALAAFARERFDVASIDYRWSAHDYMPADGLPMIGSLKPLGGRTLIATGMRKWGLAMGTAAGRILADQIAGLTNPWADTFSPLRMPNVGALAPLAKHGAATAQHLVGDRIKREGGAADLEPGEGALVDAGIGKTALYRDEAGGVHAMSARCTHMGCIVGWNAAESTWDCPCHGSRFTATGDVLDGPATAPLAPKPPPG